MQEKTFPIEFNEEKDRFIPISKDGIAHNATCYNTVCMGCIDEQIIDEITMQEKTLEEEFEEYMKGKVIGTTIKGEKDKVFIDGEYNLEMGRLLSFVSSREEKAREEGRKEGLKVMKNNIVEEICKEAITQYKEELLGKIEEHCKKVRMEDFTLSEVKKLL